MPAKRKRKQKSRHYYHWDKQALFILFLQCMAFGAFILWCLEEHIPFRYSLPPIILGILILSALILEQIAKAHSQTESWWDDDTCSGWRGY